VRQHVEVGVKEGMRETGRERVRHERRHTALAGDEDARPGVVTRASIEAGVTKCVRVSWGRQRGVQRTKGRQQVTYSRANEHQHLGLGACLGGAALARRGLSSSHTVFLSSFFRFVVLVT
jgi:hypothetical protein